MNNFSQNCDRETGSSRPGICPCLTPSMVPYVTNRGGPVIGLEALSLQGIPVDDLLLTRESEDNMADLAGMDLLQIKRKVSQGKS